MKINLTTLHFKASEALEKMVDEKVGKLFHQNEKIIHADVTLYEEGKNIVKNQYCEIVLSVPGENLFAKKSAEKYEHAITETVQALQKKMRRKKNQIVSGRKAS